MLCVVPMANALSSCANLLFHVFLDHHSVAHPRAEAVCLMQMVETSPLIWTSCLTVKNPKRSKKRGRLSAQKCTGVELHSACTEGTGLSVWKP